MEHTTHSALSTPLLLLLLLLLQEAGMIDSIVSGGHPRVAHTVPYCTVPCQNNSRIIRFSISTDSTLQYQQASSFSPCDT